MKWGVLPILVVYFLFSVSTFYYYMQYVTPQLEEWTKSGVFTASLNPASEKYDTQLFEAYVERRDIDLTVEILEEKVRSGEADAGAYYLLGTLLPEASANHGDTATRLLKAGDYLAAGYTKYPDTAFLGLENISDHETVSMALEKLRGNLLISSEDHQKMVDGHNDIIEADRRIREVSPLYDKYDEIGKEMQRLEEEGKILSKAGDSERWRQNLNEWQLLRREQDVIKKEIDRIREGS